MSSAFQKAPTLLVALVFLYAGIDKAFHYDGFVNALESYAVLPRGLGPVLALPLILVEILTGFAIFVKAWRRPALATAAGLLVIFSIALTVNMLVNPEAICGCWFTVTVGKATGFHLAQNLVWLGLALIGWWEEGQPKSDPNLEKELVPTANG